MDQILELSKALLTPVIAILAAYVAWQQWKTNRRKLKLDLFDRRYAIFEKIGEFVGTILATGRVQPGKDIQFLVDTKSAKFLFGEEISQFVLEAYRKAVELHSLELELEVATGETRKSIISAQRKIKDWFGQSLEKLEVRFAEFLTLEH